MCTHERSSERSKKKKLPSEADCFGRQLPEASVVAAKYEVLRMAALGQPLPPDARNGLALLLRQGMWGWALAMGRIAAQERAGNCATPRSTTPRQNNAVLQILAAMAMKANIRRAA